MELLRPGALRIAESFQHSNLQINTYGESLQTIIKIRARANLLFTTGRPTISPKSSRRK